MTEIGKLTTRIDTIGQKNEKDAGVKEKAKENKQIKNDKEVCDSSAAAALRSQTLAQIKIGSAPDESYLDCDTDTDIDCDVDDEDYPDIGWNDDEDCPDIGWNDDEDNNFDTDAYEMHHMYNCFFPLFDAPLSAKTVLEDTKQIENIINNGIQSNSAYETAKKYTEEFFSTNPSQEDVISKFCSIALVHSDAVGDKMAYSQVLMETFLDEYRDRGGNNFLNSADAYYYRHSDVSESSAKKLSDNELMLQYFAISAKERILFNDQHDMDDEEGERWANQLDQNRNKLKMLKNEIISRAQN